MLVWASVKFLFIFLVWRKEVPCFAAHTILYVQTYWLGNAEVETGTPGIAAALALAFVSNLFATLTPYVCSSVFLRSGTFIAGHVISGLCTISCSFCWALHYCNRVVQGDGHNWHHPNQFCDNKSNASWWRKVLFLQAGFIFMLAYYIQWLVVGGGLKKLFCCSTHLHVVVCCHWLYVFAKVLYGGGCLDLFDWKCGLRASTSRPLTSLDEIFSRLAFVGPFPAQRFACLSRSLLLQNLEMSWFASACRNQSMLMAFVSLACRSCRSLVKRNCAKWELLAPLSILNYFDPNALRNSASKCCSRCSSFQVKLRRPDVPGRSACCTEVPACLSGAGNTFKAESCFR